ncbi:unnamed protein product, partial [Symbiodinium pilosum]
MPDAEVHPNLISYNAAISSCAKSQQWQLVVKLFEGMQMDNVAPDVVGYTAVISSCARGQQWMLALQIFNNMPIAK